MSTRKSRADRKRFWEAFSAASRTRVREPGVYAGDAGLTREQLTANLLAPMDPPDLELATRQADALIAAGLVTVTEESPC